MHLWHDIIGFHRAVTLKIFGESVSYHRFCPAEGVYHSMIPYQKSTKNGLSVDVDWKDDRNVKLLDDYGALYKTEFLPACTIHTHVDISAFESGTDAKDEEMQPGWHITLGKLVSSKMYDLDFRMRLPKIPAVTRRMGNTQAIKIGFKNLFLDSVTYNEIAECPGTLGWTHLINRVES